MTNGPLGDEYMRSTILAVLRRNGTDSDSATEELVRLFRVAFDAVKEAARDDADSDWSCTLRAIDAQTYPVNKPLYDRAWETVRFIRRDEIIESKE